MTAEEVVKAVKKKSNESYYNLLLALDGESSLGGIQMMYQLFDDEGNELTAFGDIEIEAFEQFMSE